MSSADPEAALCVAAVAGIRRSVTGGAFVMGIGKIGKDFNKTPQKNIWERLGLWKLRVQQVKSEGTLWKETHSKFQSFDSFIKGSLVGETSVLRTFRMSGKELVKERVRQRKS